MSDVKILESAVFECFKHLRATVDNDDNPVLLGQEKALAAIMALLASQRTAPEGWKLVPRELTETMHAAAMNVPVLGPHATARLYRAVHWRALYDAAPSAPEGT